MTREQTGDKARLPTFRLCSRYCAVGLYAHVALWGSLEFVFPNNTGVSLLTAIILALLATHWAIFDAKSRGWAILPVLQMLYFLTWPTGATIYLITRSGWRGIVLAALHAIALTLCMGVAFYVTFISLQCAGLLGPQYYP